MSALELSKNFSAFAGTWALDPAATTVAFTTKAMWVLPVKATVKATSGSATVTADGDISGTFVLDAASFDTGMKKRDVHLQSADFFDVAKFPTMTYAVTSARLLGPKQLEFAGNLTIRDQTLPFVVVADVSPADGSAVLAIETDLDRSLWGISWTKMGAGLDNHIIVSARYTRS